MAARSCHGPRGNEHSGVIAYPLLVLEAATTAGSVALFPDAARAVARAVPMGASREDLMLPAIDALCRDTGIAVADIRTVVCGAGPGSFTSLRIAASIAKGIVHANRLLRGESVELYAVSSLLLAAASIEMAGDYLVHADAMRGERFVQHVVIDADGIVEGIGETYRATAAMLAGDADANTSVSNVARRDHLSRVAVVATVPVLDADRIVTPRADLLFKVRAWRENGPVDLVRWEPAYGRLAEAQVKWEAAHGTPLPAMTQ
jgi:tRNA threonylcarbamoyladenosine biosynthesis protein TsaB